METAVEILQFVAVAAAAIVAGGQLFCLLAVIPALPAFPSDVSAHIHQEALSRRPHRYLRVFGAVTVVSTVAILAVERDFGEAAMILTALGFLLALANALLSRREWPINHEIDSYGEQPTEAQVESYRTLRKRWDEQHRVRTAASMLALACFAAAAAFF